MPAWDDIPEEREAVPAPADGGRRRVRRARRRPGRPDRRRDRAAGLRRQHPGVLHLGRQRLLRARARTARSASCWPRTASPPPSTCTSRRSTSSAAWTCWAPRRSTTSTTPAGAWAGSTPYKGMKLLASHLGGTRNPMAVRWPAKIKPDADAARPVPPLQRRRPHDLRGRSASRRRAWSTAFPRTRSTASASPTPSTTPTPKAGCGPSTSRSWAAARSTTTAGWPPRFGPRAALGSRAAARHRRLDPGPGHLGALQPRPGLVPGPRPRRPDAREAGAAARRPSPSRRPGTASTPSAAACGSRSCTPSCGSRRPTGSGTSPATSSGCPSSAHPALGNRANVVTIDLDIPADANGVLYALGGAGGGLTCYVDDGHPVLRVQHLHRHANQDPLRPTSCPPGGATIEVTHRVRRAHARRDRSTSR